MSKNLKNKVYAEIMIRWTNGARYVELMGQIEDYAEQKLPYSKSHPSKLHHTLSSVHKFLEYENMKTVINAARAKIVKDFKTEIINIMYAILSERYERLRLQGRITLDEIEARIYQDAPFVRVQDMLYQLVDQWAAETVAEPKKELAALAALAADKQNVHTQVVNKQTNDAMEVFTKMSVPKGQSTLDEIVTCWLQSVPNVSHQIDTVYQDMRKWGNEKSVIETNDYVYRKTLRGVWAKIKTYEGEMRVELEKRLWEECYESVGMCAQGHLSRLANVMVGYDMTIVATINPMEDFQNKMAALAASSTEDFQTKSSAAHRLMDAVNMPIQDRHTWLEALE